MVALIAVLTVICANPEPAEQLCIAHAAARFGLPQALLTAVREQEGGRAGGWQVNADGSIDYGVMQINSRWLPQLEPLGYSAVALTYDGCASITAGAWILSGALAEAGVWRRDAADAETYWRAVGRYHSRTRALNRAYAEKVWARYLRLRMLGPPRLNSASHEHKAGSAGLAASTVDAGATGNCGNPVATGSAGNTVLPR
jgi:soluble lytic murein transglycosylase-like protein